MRRTVGLFVVVGLALTGCVGIPTSGGVEAGPVIDDQTSPDFVIVPSGPTAGADQQEILEDFMLAQRSPQGGYAIAKQFLTAGFAEQWDPEAGTTVRTGAATTSPGPTIDSLDYTVTTRAVVNASGQYTELLPASQTFPFTFAQENGEWRIASAPNGVVLSQASFNVVFTERALYFFDPSYTYLVPDVRWFPSQRSLPSRIVNSLLAGPASWLQQGVVLNSFPIATTLDSIEIVSGTATVELSPEALSASQEDRDRMRQQLAASLDVTTVNMRVGGLVLQTPAVGTGAIKVPQVESAALVGTGEEFGFDTSDGIAPIGGLSSKVVAAGAIGATLASDKQSVAILAANGVSIVRTSDDAAALIDNRSGLVPPSLDPFRFIWSAQGASAGSLIAFEVDGEPHPVGGLPTDASIVSIDVSRDGTRLLIYGTTSAGPTLIVAGIIRQQGSNIPTALGELLYLPVSAGRPIDATWVDGRSVATVSKAGDAASVMSVEIAGPSAVLGDVLDAKAIAGGNNGTDGLRILRPDGELWRPQGGGWVSTGLVASLLGTKQ